GGIAGFHFIRDTKAATRPVDKLAHELLQPEFWQICRSRVTSQHDLILLHLNVNDANSIQEFVRYFGKSIVAGTFLTLTFAINQQSIVVFGHRHSRIAAIAGQILTARKDDETVGVRMRMAGRQTPVGKLSQRRFSVMALRGPTLERESRRVF